MKRKYLITSALILIAAATFISLKNHSASTIEKSTKSVFESSTEQAITSLIPYSAHENFRLLIPNFNHTTKQEDIHLLQFRKGNTQDSHNIMIDVAFTDQANEKLIPWLKSQGITQIDEIFITHPHQDHYGGLWALINSNFPVKKIWMNIPKKEICDRELPWGCNYKEIQELMTAIKSKGVEVKPLILDSVNQPKVLYQDANNKVELLYASSPVNPVLGSMDINDLSMIIKLNTNGISYLFTGDLNLPLSNYLADHAENLNSDILKAPHHGAESVASNAFLDKVKPAIALVPSPQWLWCSDRSERYRNYFKEHNIQTYISGIHGDIVIRHFDDSPMTLEVEHPNVPVCK